MCLSVSVTIVAVIAVNVCYREHRKKSTVFKVFILNLKKHAISINFEKLVKLIQKLYHTAQILIAL